MPETPFIDYAGPEAGAQMAGAERRNKHAEYLRRLAETKAASVPTSYEISSKGLGGNPQTGVGAGSKGTGQIGSHNVGPRGVVVKERQVIQPGGYSEFIPAEGADDYLKLRGAANSKAVKWDKRAGGWRIDPTMIDSEIEDEKTRKALKEYLENEKSKADILEKEQMREERAARIKKVQQDYDLIVAEQEERERLGDVLGAKNLETAKALREKELNDARLGHYTKQGEDIDSKIAERGSRIEHRKAMAAFNEKKWGEQLGVKNKELGLKERAQNLKEASTAFNQDMAVTRAKTNVWAITGRQGAAQLKQAFEQKEFSIKSRIAQLNTGTLTKQQEETTATELALLFREYNTMVTAADSVMEAPQMPQPNVLGPADPLGADPMADPMADPAMDPGVDPGMGADPGMGGGPPIDQPMPAPQPMPQPTPRPAAQPAPIRPGPARPRPAAAAPVRSNVKVDPSEVAEVHTMLAEGTDRQALRKAMVDEGYSLEEADELIRQAEAMNTPNGNQSL